MSRFLALTVTSLALLAMPAYAQHKAAFTVAECQQGIADVKEMLKSESTDPDTEKTVKDILETSADLCAK